MKKILIILVIVLIVALVGIEHFVRNTYDVVVTELVVKRSDDKDKYLVYTKLLSNDEVRVFKNEDSLLERKFRSSDLQAYLEKGGRYRLTVYGWRIGFLSTYENIVKARDLPASYP